MSAKDNPVYSIALQGIIKQERTPSPEEVLLGYAKIFTMKETTLNAILSESDMRDVEEARTVLEERGLDLELIKQGFPLIISWIRRLSKINETPGQKTAETDLVDPSSKEILESALNGLTWDIDDAFHYGSNIQTVTDLVNRLREKVREQEENKENSKTGHSEEQSKSMTATAGAATVPAEVKKAEPAETPVSSEKEDEKKPEEEKTGKEKRDSDLASWQEDVLKRSKNRRAAVSGQGSWDKHRKEDFYQLDEEYCKMTTTLLEAVKGQEQAVLKFVQGCFHWELSETQTYFFFFGPPGVGKTLLAETAAEYLKIPYKRMDMVEYSDKGLGNDADDFVKKNPRCVILFDEIEKAHPLVVQQFLRILNGDPKKSAFKDAILIFTSNVGASLYKDESEDLTRLPESIVVDAIRNEKDDRDRPVLSPELCSRIAAGNLIMFNHLKIRYLSELVHLRFKEIADSVMNRYECLLSYEREIPMLYLYHRGGNIDARVAIGKADSFMKNEVYEFVRQLENREGEKTRVPSISLSVDWNGVEEDIRKLFFNNSRMEILLLTDRKDLLKEEEERYKIYRASTVAEAKEFLKEDISAVFIDPIFGGEDVEEKVLSATDYHTPGAAFFGELARMNTDVEIFMMDLEQKLSETDRRTFYIEGAAGTLAYYDERPDAFARQAREILDELYMERESMRFVQQGWVLEFDSRQSIREDSGAAQIEFYNIRKCKAVDVETRDAMVSDAERPDIGFDDVIGAENAKSELRYFVEYLKNPKMFLAKGGTPPKGVLLYGPPGTGKTMLARAMAGESDVSFIPCNATDFANKYVGNSEENIRKVFARARRYAPAIIFIDEIDAIGKQRTGSDSLRHDEKMLNALLTEMDGFKGNNKRPVFVLAATNFGARESDGIGKLDEALMRRFSNKIRVDLPKEAERKTFIERMVEKKKAAISPDIIANLAERTPGESLAILENILDLAFRNAMKEGRSMEGEDLLTALEDYLYGEKRTHSMEYYKRVAIHETGHAYVSYLSGDAPSYITIESRGDFGGYMQHANSEERPGYNREELIGKIRTALAGRAAEQVFYGEEIALNTGAGSDLQSATNTAFRMILNYGMVGGQLVALSREEVMKSSLASNYIEQVNTLLQEQMKITLQMVEEGRDVIESIAAELVKENRLTGAQFGELMRKK